MGVVGIHKALYGIALAHRHGAAAQVFQIGRGSALLHDQHGGHLHIRLGEGEVLRPLRRGPQGGDQIHLAPAGRLQDVGQVVRWQHLHLGAEVGLQQLQHIDRQALRPARGASAHKGGVIFFGCKTDNLGLPGHGPEQSHG